MTHFDVIWRGRRRVSASRKVKVEEFYEFSQRRCRAQCAPVVCANWSPFTSGFVTRHSWSCGEFKK